MNNIDFITTFLGWCVVINFGFLMFMTFTIMIFKNSISKMHSSFFGISTEDVSKYYFQYLGNYKIAVIVLNFVPYLALKIMA